MILAILVFFLEMKGITASKGLIKKFRPKEVPEGEGARVRRIIGVSELKNIDPFVMMDHFFVDKPAGFPDHPHRGQDTVTYMIEGKCLHEDFKGHMDEISEGDVQWMTAGRGIVHSEIPGTNHMEGLQLWVSLPADHKMCEPAYQSLTKERQVKVQLEGVNATVISGELRGQRAETITRTPTYYFDLRMETNSEFFEDVPENWNGLLYVLKGEVNVKDQTLKEGEVGVLTPQESKISLSSSKGARLVMILGSPLNEPIVQYGPFVMNSKKQIEETMMDYRMQRNGFEGAHNWESKISQLRFDL